MSQRIAKITLDEASILRRTPEAEHEKSVALADLLGENLFAPKGMDCGPYDVLLRMEEGRLVFDIHSPSTGEKSKAAFAVQPLKGIIRDYFLICGSYYEALKRRDPVKLEAIDMGRRGVHNEGAELMESLLKGKISTDAKTARRLFTLVCVLLSGPA